MTRSLSSTSDTKKESTSVTTPSKASSITRIRRLSEPKKINSTPHSINTKTKSAESVSKPKSSTETKKISEAIGPSKAAESKITVSSNLISQKVKVKPSVATTSEVAKLNLNNRLNDANDNPVIDKTLVMLEDNKQQPSSITSKEFNSDDRTAVNIHEVPMETVDKGTISVHPQKHPTTSSEAGVEEVGKKYEAPYARVSSFEDQSTRNSEYAKAVPHHHQAFGGNGTAAYVGNLKMEKIPEKPQSKGGFRRLIKLGKKTPSVQPPPPPQVDTLKSLISADEHAQKSSRRLFSFPFRGEKKATSSGS
ncbi:hypothetical protein M8C21_008487 [Ambrosia artemisiifolia]|uniref:Uncharacterized protein n=1 Tax=Ambrosia artemisiifolia TaxID=4212 RepID=A0AAD5G3D4_AMBAR|nr:hypothetical protein M8C21_008487 [Ambrosia artemisiifolia]